jgi:hypothetical protein
MKNSIGAIETVYDGCRFRSRLEARWAVFFNTLDIPYEYEKEAFNLGDGIQYLPDFWMPDQKCWIEIKPVSPSDEEEDKARRLSCLTEKRVLIFYGKPQAPYSVNQSAHLIECEGWDNYYGWCECPKCRKFGIAFEGRVERIGCGCFDRERDKERASLSDRLVAAYAAANSARFDGWWRSRTGNDLQPRKFGR